MKKYKKTILIIIIIAAAIGVGYYFWRKRKRPYEDYGKARWAGDTDRETLGIRLSHEPIVEVGDAVEIVQDNDSAAYPQINGTAEVVEILEPSDAWDKKSFWIITDKPHPGSGPQEPGTYKKV